MATLWVWSFPLGASADAPLPSLDALVGLVADDMDRVNDGILARAQSHVELIPEIAGHLINSGGKRIRPMLTLAAARMCGYSGEHHIKLATAVEFMHTATLLHDDVVDESDLRRGKQAARVIWGNQASVLVGDYLLGQAFKMMVETSSLDCLRILSNAAAVIAEGEVLAAFDFAGHLHDGGCLPAGGGRKNRGAVFGGGGSWRGYRRTAARRTGGT